MTMFNFANNILDTHAHNLHTQELHVKAPACIHLLNINLHVQPRKHISATAAMQQRHVNHT